MFWVVAELFLDQLEVVPPLIPQLPMRALFDDLPIPHDNDTVGVDDCRQAMRDHDDGGPVFAVIQQRQFLYGLLHHLLAVGIQR